MAMLIFRFKGALPALLLVLFFLPAALGQSAAIGLGKRRNLVWDRRISPSNLGSNLTYYYPIFFRTSEHGAYEKTGVLGGRIRPILNLNLPEVEDRFKRYRTCKALSYVLLGGTVAALSAWTCTSVRSIIQNDDLDIGAFFAPRRLPLLGAYFACYYGSIYLNLRGDRQLQKAVAAHNRFVRRQE